MLVVILLLLLGSVSRKSGALFQSQKCAMYRIGPDPSSGAQLKVINCQNQICHRHHDVQNGSTGLLVPPLRHVRLLLSHHHLVVLNMTSPLVPTSWTAAL